MALDLSKVAGQVSLMVERLKGLYPAMEQHLEFALKTMSEAAIDLDALKRKVQSARTTWLVAGIAEGLSQRFGLPALPSDFTVLATDGSHIDVDRHQPARCYLINIGSVVLRYGSKPGAELGSTPHLYSEDADLEITPPEGGRGQTVEGALLGIKRSVEELKELVALAKGLSPQAEALALLDGSLILWGLEAYPGFVADAMITRGLLPCLDEMKALGQNRRLALASYISFPRSTDVVNVLRVAICPGEVADCDKLCPPGKERPCDGLSGVRDRDLFFNLLGAGERSALFVSPSQVVRERYGGHRIYFFYLHAGDEIARVEVPEWVALDRHLLELAHSLIFDQCRRGQGYPAALMEAHEQAVLSGADRENFRELVASALSEAHLPATFSGKSISKRMRWV